MPALQGLCSWPRAHFSLPSQYCRGIKAPCKRGWGSGLAAVPLGDSTAIFALDSNSCSGFLSLVLDFRAVKHGLLSSQGWSLLPAAVSSAVSTSGLAGLKGKFKFVL